MIVCPGCGGRNPPSTVACTFCLRRVDSASGAARPTRAGKLLVAALCALLLVAVLALIVLSPSLLGPSG